MTNNDISRVYDTILSIPGMNESIKVDLKISRKSVLLLHSVIKRGLNEKGGYSNDLLKSIPEDSLQELNGFSEDLLTKSGLTALSEKLQSLIIA